MLKSKEINCHIHPIILEDVMNITSNDVVSWNKLRSKTVLITGASGLIGSYAVYTLLCLSERFNLGIKVLALVRNHEKALKQFAGVIGRDDFTLITQDVTETIIYSGDIHYIIHAASLVGREDFIANPVGVISVNLNATENLLKLARDKAAEGFLYISSREIYGESTLGKEFICEDDYGVVNPALVRSCYPESKRMAENLCVCYKHQYGVPTTIVRLAHVYGPEYSLSSGRVWEEFVQMAVSGNDIVLNSDGKMGLALTYVSDAVCGMFCALLNGSDIIYNVGNSSEITTVKGLAETVVRLCPENKPKVVFDIKDSAGYLSHRVSFLASGKVEMLGWGAQYNLEYGLKRTIMYFRSQY